MTVTFHPFFFGSVRLRDVERRRPLGARSDGVRTVRRSQPARVGEVRS